MITGRYGGAVEPTLLARAPLDPDALRRAVLRPDRLWRRVVVLAETDSTNAEVIKAAWDGEPEGLVVVAEHQRAGRGRIGRRWSCPPRAGLTLSVLLRPAESTPGRPPAPVPQWGWLPLLAGVALVEAVGAVTGLTAQVKWPNDLLVADGKCAGVLAEVAGDAVVLGIGLNVTVGPAELPPRAPDAPPATSLALAGATNLDRVALAGALLDRVGDWYQRWRAAGGDADRCGLRPAYLAACATVGRPVRAVLPGEDELIGTVVGVDPDGRLVLSTPTGRQEVAAADIVHLRATPENTAGGR